MVLNDLKRRIRPVQTEPNEPLLQLDNFGLEK